MATLPTGVYTDSINNKPYTPKTPVQGIIKVIDNPVSRIGTPGGNVGDLTVTLEGDVPNATILEQILHYDEHYNGIYDLPSNSRIRYTLDDLEANGWITSAEKSELGSKYLDTTMGFTTANRYFQYVENNGTWYLKGFNVAAVNLQAHGGGEDANSIFTNKGKIIGLNEASTNNDILGRHVAFMFTEGVVSRKHEGFDNTGTVEMRAAQSLGYLIAYNASSYQYSKIEQSNGNNSLDYSTGRHYIMNNGDMKFYGNNNIGVYTNSAPKMTIRDETYVYSDGSWYKGQSITGGLERSEIKLNNPLTILGDQSIGVDIVKTA